MNSFPHGRLLSTCIVAFCVALSSCGGDSDSQSADDGANLDQASSGSTQGDVEGTNADEDKGGESPGAGENEDRGDPGEDDSDSDEGASDGPSMDDLAPAAAEELRQEPFGLTTPTEVMAKLGTEDADYDDLPGGATFVSEMGSSVAGLPCRLGDGHIHGEGQRLFGGGGGVLEHGVHLFTTTAAVDAHIAELETSEIGCPTFDELGQLDSLEPVTIGDFPGFTWTTGGGSSLVVTQVHSDNIIVFGRSDSAELSEQLVQRIIDQL